MLAASFGGTQVPAGAEQPEPDAFPPAGTASKPARRVCYRASIPPPGAADAEVLPVNVPGHAAGPGNR